MKVKIDFNGRYDVSGYNEMPTLIRPRVLVVHGSEPEPPSVSEPTLVLHESAVGTNDLYFPVKDTVVIAYAFNQTDSAYGSTVDPKIKVDSNLFTELYSYADSVAKPPILVKVLKTNFNNDSNKLTIASGYNPWWYGGARLVYDISGMDIDWENAEFETKGDSTITSSLDDIGDDKYFYLSFSYGRNDPDIHLVGSQSDCTFYQKFEDDHAQSLVITSYRQANAYISAYGANGGSPAILKAKIRS